MPLNDAASTAPDPGPIRIGLVAGSGRLPLLFAQAVRDHTPHAIVAVAHRQETDPALEDLVEEITWVRLGQFKRTLKAMARGGASQVVFAGGISKFRIWRIRPDALALKMAARLRHLHDDLLLRAIADLVESHGFQVRGVTDFFPGLLISPGALSSREPTPEQWADIQFGWRAAKALGEMDIGQGVVVRRKVVVAVEAMEGTDAMITRAGPLAGGQGVLVKVCKPQQDRRLDMPTIGPGTMTAMARARVPVLAVEAGAVILLDPEQTLREADRLGLTVIACQQERIDSMGNAHEQSC